MTSLLTTDLEDVGELEISAPDFENQTQMPDYVGVANENENPELHIDTIPDETESLVLVVDDPDAVDVVGFTFDHWLVWDIDPEQNTIPRGWDPESATEGFNDFLDVGYGGPSPPDGTHGYRFKVLALDGELGLPPEARKAVIDMTIMTEDVNIVGSSQLVGTYDASQGTVF